MKNWKEYDTNVVRECSKKHKMTVGEFLYELLNKDNKEFEKELDSIQNSFVQQKKEKKND